jgi:hypothetical protein
MYNLTTFVEGTEEFFNQKTNHRYLSIKKTKKIVDSNILVGIDKEIIYAWQ